MPQGLDVPIADHHIGFSADERRNQRGDISARVLIVAVRVDDEIGAELERRIDAGGKRCRKTAPVAKRDDVLHPRGPGDFHRRIG